MLVYINWRMETLPSLSKEPPWEWETPWEIPEELFDRYQTSREELERVVEEIDKIQEEQENP